MEGINLQYIVMISLDNLVDDNHVEVSILCYFYRE